MKRSKSLKLMMMGIVTTSILAGCDSKSSIDTTDVATNCVKTDTDGCSYSGVVGSNGTIPLGGSGGSGTSTTKSERGGFGSSANKIGNSGS